LFEKDLLIEIDYDNLTNDFASQQTKGSCKKKEIIPLKNQIF